ncbi:MAG: MopE-related protein, partial [Chitinophagaceae bacterium]
WAKQLRGVQNNSFFAGENHSYSIAVDAQTGAVYTTGYFIYDVDFDPGPGTNILTAIGSDVFISKLDNNGNFLWAKQFAGSDPNENGTSMSISFDNSGNVYTTGHFSGTYDFDPGAGIYNLTNISGVFVSKLDISGNFIWAKQWTHHSTYTQACLAVDVNSNIYVTGTFNQTVDFDPGAGMYNLTAGGAQDVFVSKLDASGNFIWAKQMGAPLNDPGANSIISQSIALDAAGNAYTTGYFYGIADFDPGPGIYNLTAPGNLYAMFISKINASGNFVSAVQIGPRVIGYSLAVDAVANIYITGVFGLTPDFDPGAGTYNLTSAGNDDIFVLKLQTVIVADQDGDGYTVAQGDCNDNNAAIHPGATEVCNGVDDNCNGMIDEGLQTTYYQDMDGDGYGNAAVTIQACTLPAGYVSNSTDCNDANAAVNPGATEVCNGVDDNCNGMIDEGLQTTYYRDVDGDGYGNAVVTIQACTLPAGYVSNSTDCNDANAAVNPGGTEVCNGVDDNCNGMIDEGLQTTYYRDMDGDSYGNAAATTQACTVPSGYVSNNTDCNDANSAVNPGATEVCNGVDDNCNGMIDEGCISVSLSIADVTVNETVGTAIIPVTLSAATGNTVTVKYRSSNGTARHPKDYTHVSGTLTFNPGETIKNIIVPIIAEALAEPDENFFIELSKPVNATISDGSGTVTITEAAPLKSFKNNPVTEASDQDKLIVPNPQRKNEPLRFYGVEPGSFDLVMNDVNGKVVANIRNYRNNSSMTSLTPGLYFYHLSYKNQNGELQRKTGKILITD